MSLTLGIGHVRSRVIPTLSTHRALCSPKGFLVRISQPSRQLTRVNAESQRRGGLGDEDIDVAVFRFTLGIPGFDDRLIPRVVGSAIGVLLVANHLLGAQPTPDAQLRSEWLGALLATVCFFVPDIEERLRESMPGRGRQKTADKIDGSSNCFFLDASLPDTSKKELAWASFSLLKNTNCCGLLLASGGRVLMARGALGSTVVTAGDAAASLAAMSQDVASSSGIGRLKEVTTGAVPSVWLPERSTFSSGGVQALASVPAGVQCLMLQHVAAGGERPSVLMVFSERPRALTDRERSWVAAVADKLAPFV